jgi:hypothetical protein
MAIPRRSAEQGEAIPARTTLLALVQQLGRRGGRSEEQVVAAALELVRSGRVVLTGNFAGAAL